MRNKEFYTWSLRNKLKNSPVAGWGGLSKKSNVKWMSKIGSYA